MVDLFMMGHLVRDCSTARCLKRGPGCHKRQRYIWEQRRYTARVRDVADGLGVTKVFDGAEMPRLYCEAWEENE